MLPNATQITNGTLATAVPRLDVSATAVIALLCIAASILASIAIGRGQPLWLDEVWTGAIIAQPDIGALFHEIYLDVNAPLYFVLMYGWSKLFGLSNVALRIPSLLFGAAAPVLIACTRVPGLPREARLVWAAFLALSLPGIWFSQEVRCYALLLFACTAQALVFARLLTAARLTLACWWAAWSSVAILTHYYAGFLTAFEGLAYLAVWRARALRTWPAVFMFAPASGWIIYHLPRLAEYLRPGIEWYSVLQPIDLLYILQFLAGAPIVPLAFMLAAVIAYLIGRGTERPQQASSLACHTIIIAAAAAACLIVGIGFLRPTFTLRYLIPVVPGFCLALALAAHALARRWAWSYALVLVICLGGTMLWAHDRAKLPRYLVFEAATRDLAADGISNLVFTLDSPVSAVLHASTLEGLGRFFFDRDRQAVSVTAVTLHSGEDASTTLLASAQSPRSGILWLYDLNTHDTIARVSPPHVAELDRHWRCRNYGTDSIGVLACVNTEQSAGAASVR